MDFTKYQNKMEYPKRALRPTLPIDATSEQARQYGEDLARWIEDEKDVKKRKEEYRDEDSRLFEQFKEDALDDVGLKGHPKADKAFALAWEDGHSGGYQGAYNELSKLADVLL